MGFMPGPLELLIVAAIALLLFGKRLPQAARDLGSSFHQFQAGLKGIESDIHEPTGTPSTP